MTHQTAISTDPGEHPFDDPAPGNDGECVQLVALDDFDLPATAVRGGRGDAQSLIAGIGKDAQDEGPQRAGAFVEDRARAVAILNIGRVCGDAQQQPKRIDENVPQPHFLQSWRDVRFEEIEMDTAASPCRRIGALAACLMPGMPVQAAPAAAESKTFAVSGAVETVATAINDDNVIAGSWVDSDDTEHGFVRAAVGTQRLTQ
jgi:hypothetical protein